MDSRRDLVEKIIKMMEQGRVFTSDEWNRGALSPQNPISCVRYKGVNKLRLMNAVIENEYKDPRWATAIQLRDKGYSVKRGEHGVLCEKWIFTKEVKVENENGNLVKKSIELEKPQVRYFTVFNGEQIVDFPPLDVQKRESNTTKLIDDFMSCSECKIDELGQSRAFYSPVKDSICLPLREYFKSDVSFANTVVHEMIHSTGHATRLNRPLINMFGSPDYAKEELRAELGALFIGADLNLPVDGEHYQDHSNYLSSWIRVLKDDYNELFRACADAEKGAERLMTNYRIKFKEIDSIEEIPKNDKIPDKQSTQLKRA